MVFLPHILLCSCSADNDNLHVFGNLIPKLIKIDFYMLHLSADFNGGFGGLERNCHVLEILLVVELVNMIEFWDLRCNVTVDYDILRI